MRSPGEKLNFGFTLIELLVVIAIIGLLVALLLPAIESGESRARMIECLGNKRQLIIAWHLYIEDNDGQVPLNDLVPIGGNWGWPQPWCGLNMNWSPHGGATNWQWLLDPHYSSLGPYIGRWEIEHCPEDSYLSPAQKAAGYAERVRSVSMNRFVGWLPVRYDGIAPTYWKVYHNLDDFNSLTPSRAWIFIDEHPDSISYPMGLRVWFDPGLVSGYNTENIRERTPYAVYHSAIWGQMPSDLHNGGATLAFADGHAICKHWVDHSIMRPVTYRYFPASYLSGGIFAYGIRSTNLVDWLWMVQRTTVPK